MVVVVTFVGTALCILATVVNVAFVAYATLCRHMFDNLKQ
jgi:hypothetical protein